METGPLILAAGAVLSVLSAGTLSPVFRRSVPKPEGVQKALVLASFASVSCALAVIVWSSLSSDFTYSYVWEHSSSGLATVYKLSAVWAGGEGSLLLCTWLMSLALVVELTVRRRKHAISNAFSMVLASVMSLLVAFFSATVILSGLFDVTSPADLLRHPDGLGMDVQLQTPEMAVHAPLIFGAYAAMSVLFASAVAHHLTDEALWDRVALPWGRLAWLLLTAGIGLGAVWAYYVIGWGGYWSWDPVETASLIPWFMVTAFLHSQQRGSRRGEYAVASPLFAMLSLVGVVFVSFVVRAGGMWKYSVHDYGASAGSSVASRLLSLLRDEPSLMGTFIFMLLLLTATSYLSVRAVRKRPAEPSSPPLKHLRDYITDQNNMFLAITLLATAALLAATLMFMNAESDPDETAIELNQKMSVFFVALMVTLSLCLTWRMLGSGRAMYLALILVAASLALAIVGAFSESIDGLVAFALPSFLCAVAASSVRLAQSLSKGAVRRRVHRAGAQVSHLGVALLLTAFIVSSNLQTFPSEGNVVALQVDSRMLVGDYIVRLVAIEVSDEVGGYPVGVVQVRTAVVDIYRSTGELLEDDARLEILYGDNPAGGVAVLERVAYVRSSLSEDLYMSFEWMSGTTALLHAKVIPMMFPLWIGCVLLIFGLSMRFLSDE